MSYIISALKEWLLLYVMAPIVLLIQNHAGPAGTSLFLSLTGVVIGGLITLTSIFVKE